VWFEILLEGDRGKGQLVVVAVRAVACLIVASLSIAAGTNAADGPLAQITAPRDGFKLRSGRSVSVRALVKAGVVPLRDWTLKLFDSDGSAAEIGRGVQAVDDEVVGEIDADSLVPGASYTLHLAVSDASDALATAQSAVRFSDPQYTLIPLEARNLAAGGEITLALDASGALSIIGGRVRYGGELIVRNSASGSVRHVYIDLGASVGLAVSGNGQRLFYFGTFPGASSLGLGFLDFPTGTTSFIAAHTSHLFAVDHSGTRLAFQAGPPGGTRPVRQYHLFDSESGTIRQLTSSPDAIVYNGTARDAACVLCQATPLIPIRRPAGAAYTHDFPGLPIYQNRR
jgi:hypothetical protein